MLPLVYTYGLCNDGSRVLLNALVRPPSIPSNIPNYDRAFLVQKLSYLKKINLVRKCHGPLLRCECTDWGECVVVYLGATN